MEDGSENDSSAFNSTMSARGPTSDIFGKLDTAVPEVRINSDALEILRRKAADNQMTLSEWIRIRLYVDAMGLDHVLSVNEARIRRASGNVGQVALPVRGEVSAQ